MIFSSSCNRGNFDITSITTALNPLQETYKSSAEEGFAIQAPNALRLLSPFEIR
jgi:hypothetical protein